MGVPYFMEHALFLSKAKTKKSAAAVMNNTKGYYYAENHYLPRKEDESYR